MYLTLPPNLAARPLARTNILCHNISLSRYFSLTKRTHIFSTYFSLIKKTNAVQIFSHSVSFRLLLATDTNSEVTVRCSTRSFRFPAPISRSLHWEGEMSEEGVNDCRHRAVTKFVCKTFAPFLNSRRTRIFRRSPAFLEVVNETMGPSFGNSDTESAEEEGDDVVTVIYDGSDDSMDGQRETNTEDKDDPALSGVATTVKDSDDEEEEEEEEEEEDEEDEDDDSDEEWVMKSKKFWSPPGAAEGPAAASSERPEASSEAEHEPPMVWCNNCNAEFTRSCYRLRHKRIYGCIQCGTKDVANTTTTTSTAGNSDGNTPNSNQDVANTTTTTSTAGNSDGNTPNSNQDVANTTTTTSTAGNSDGNTPNSNQDVANTTTTTSTAGNSDGNTPNCNQDVANTTTTTSTAGNPDANTPNSNQDVANTTTTTSTAGNPDANTPNSNQDVANTTTTTSAGNPESNNQEIATNTTTRNAEHGALNFQDLAVCFGDLHSFQKHARHCHGIKEFRDPCPDCGKFITLRNKVSGGPPHICEHKARPNSCLVCGKGFASQKGLLSHMTWVHLKGKPNIVRCNYCLKRFTFRKQKIEHEKVHQNEELKFSCPHCPLRFPDCYERSAHRKTHRVFNTFTCKVCNRTFKQACKLERHMAVHTGLKPYTCKLCDRSFNQSGHLKSHMRVHTGERPFKCQDCGQCFNHNVSLKNHIQRKHKPRAGEWTSGEEEDRGDLGSGLN
ncbi:uncharacterized protein LOC143134566 isoform X2 [Alosa pseudoharengus]|uniref:uncharacterized protein LOC143134566 isoform X2 n=1 Tax=Alosa pseudoharengus TaxID=34774 RepID=UPI003F8B3E6D